MNHNKKKKYINLKEEGKTADELLALMLEEGVPEEDAKEVIEEIFNDTPEVPKPEKKQKAQEAIQHNQVYEEWKLESNGRGGFERSRKIKETKISPDRAERLNEQMANRKIEYVKKGGTNA